MPPKSSIMLGDLCFFVHETCDCSFVDPETYVSTDSMLPDKAGITQAESIPSTGTVSKYQPKDVLLSNIRPYFKKIWQSTRNGTCSNDVLVIRAKDERISDYLFALLSENRFFDHVMLGSKGTKMPRGDKEQILTYTICDLPFSEMLAIGGWFSLINQKISCNQAINDNLSEQGQAIFNELILNGEAASEERLTDIAHFQNGLPMQKNRPIAGEGLPVLKIKELGQGRCDDSSERCRDDIDHSVLINNGDVVFSWSGSLMAKIWCGGKCGLNQHLFKVTSEKYPLWFYYYWLQYHMPDFIDIAANKATTMGHICRNHLDDAIVSIPHPEIMKKADSVLSLIINAQIKSMEEITQLTVLRDYLLPKLMSGEIDVSTLEIPN